MCDAPYLCSQHSTAADIMMSIPIEITLAKCEISQDDYPLLANCLQRKFQRSAFARPMQRIIEVNGLYVGFDEMVRGGFLSGPHG